MMKSAKVRYPIANELSLILFWIRSNLMLTFSQTAAFSVKWFLFQNKPLIAETA
jgi:hypothetical protein